MKKPHLSILLTAMLAASSGVAVASTTNAAEPKIETRTIILNGDIVSSSSSISSEVADVQLAQVEPGKFQKEVRVYTTGDGNAIRGHSLPDIDVIVSNAMSAAFSSGGSSLSMGNPVKNAPYSAEVISEKIQTLPDGNQITSRTTSLAFRDGVGRTRQETRNGQGEVTSIQINDAIEGVRYVLSPAKKTATKLTVDKDFAKRIEAIREKAKAAAKVDGHSVIIERGNPGEEIVVKRYETPSADGKNNLREEAVVKVVRVGGDVTVNTNGKTVIHKIGGDGDSIGGSLASLAKLGDLGSMSHSFQDVRWAAKSTVTELGVRDFDGVRADGKRTSYTIPAGEIGNKNPLTVTSESWFSPELQVTIYSKKSDPRTGDTIYRLANLKRSDQPMTLFTVPANYTLQDSRAIGAATQK